MVNKSHYEIIEIKDIKLYDGDELKMRNTNFSINVDGENVQLSTSDFYNNPLRDITEIISDNELKQIVSTQSFIETKKLFVNYKSEKNLDIYYCQDKSFILLFSMGEFQPFRYMVFLEGIWMLN